MTHRLVVAIALVVTGSLVVALPDDGRRLVSFSRDHGPSAVDAAGTSILLLGWGIVLSCAWSGRRRVVQRLRPLGLIVALLFLAGGFLLILWSVLGNHGAWWVVGIALAVAPQLAVLIAARLE